jgi:glycine hydroxymethyltransferase
MVPFDTESPFVTSGIRVGTAALTSRGVKENEIAQMVQLMDKVLMNASNEQIIAEVRKEVNALMSDKPLFAW